MIHSRKNYRLVVVGVVVLVVLLGGFAWWKNQKKIDPETQQLLEDIQTLKKTLGSLPNEMLEKVISPSPEEAQEIIQEKEAKVIRLLKERNLNRLTEFIHPEKGIRFSPYSSINVPEDRVYSIEEFRNALADKKKYQWGYEDGSGEPLLLTFTEYYNRFIDDADYINAQQKGYNQILGRGNTLNNIFETYPGSIVVEYHFPGFDPQYEGMDWKSLRLVFEEYNGEWLMVGLVHDAWTI